MKAWTGLENSRAEPLPKARLSSDKREGCNSLSITAGPTKADLSLLTPPPRNTFIGVEQEKRDTGTELCVNQMMLHVFH